VHIAQQFPEGEIDTPGVVPYPEVDKRKGDEGTRRESTVRLLNLMTSRGRALI
jgi:hypothetical protein